MKLTAIPFPHYTKYKIDCTKCGRRLADYIVYIENGLVDPVKDCIEFRKTHRCSRRLAER